MTYPTLLGTSGHGSGGMYDGTYYANVGLGRCPMGVAFKTESYVSQIIRVPGTIRHLSWRLDMAVDNELTLVLRQNSANSDLAITIGACTSGWVTSSSTDIVDVSSGDVLDFAVEASGCHDTAFYCISACFDATTDSAQLLTAVGPASIIGGSSPSFFNFQGVLEADPTEIHQQFYCLTAGVWQSMACYIDSNTFSGSSVVVRNRIGLANGSMAISTSSIGKTGYFEDTSDSDSVSAGDLLNYAIAVPDQGMHSVDLIWIGAHFLASDPSYCMIGGSNGVPANIPSGFTTYTSLFGGQEIDLTGVSVPRATGLVPYDLTASNFTNYVPAVLGSPIATFTLLQNETMAAFTFTTMEGQTGYFTAAGTADFSVGDRCTNKIAVAWGTIEWASASLLLQSTSI
ncbi:MAG TPA: hypothetical protein VHY79_07885 [Rhizomicrobium sp.]|jgi:hypothetical protein|nr:hypothetical protein [Rhizomicrobium sp.]